MNVAVVMDVPIAVTKIVTRNLGTAKHGIRRLSRDADAVLCSTA
jgi:hypothetical protein